MTQHNLIINPKLLILVLVLDLGLKEAQNARDHNREDIVLVDVRVLLQSISGVDADGISHHLDILSANACCKPACTGAELSHLCEEIIGLNVLDRIFEERGVRC